MNVPVGPFLLVDPPDGQVADIRRILEHIDYPWRRVLPATWADPDGAVRVLWDPAMQQGSTGLFYGHRYDIVLGTRYAGWQRGAPFVFAHEVGHMVDRATFDGETCAAITELLHQSPETYRRDDDRLNGEPYPYAHTAEHNEHWSRRDKHYFLMLNEAYADLFVRTFAPAIWDGTAFPDRHGPRYPRFTHWTDDLDAVRRLTLARSITVYDDVTADHAHRDSIERAAELGLMAGKGDGRFDPDAPLTRGQAATLLVRQYDRLLAELQRP